MCQNTSLSVILTNHDTSLSVILTNDVSRHITVNDTDQWCVTVSVTDQWHITTQIQQTSGEHWQHQSLRHSSVLHHVLAQLPSVNNSSIYHTRHDQTLLTRCSECAVVLDELQVLSVRHQWLEGPHQSTLGYWQLLEMCWRRHHSESLAKRLHTTDIISILPISVTSHLSK